MKKIIILLSLNVLIFMCTKNMEMDVEECSNHSSSNTSESSNTSHTKQNNSSQLEKLLKKQIESTNNTNVLLHTLILQNKTHFEYEDSLRHDTRIAIDKHAKDTQLAVDTIYKAANTKLKDKTLHIPMTGKTEIAKNKDSEGII